MYISTGMGHITKVFKRISSGGRSMSTLTQGNVEIPHFDNVLIQVEI